MPRDGTATYENDVAQTAAFGGLRLFVWEPPNCRRPAKKRQVCATRFYFMGATTSLLEGAV